MPVRRRAVTLADISRVTGLSKATVSHVLNDRAGYTIETRRAVLAAAKRLNYRPNHLGKALAGKASMTIGMVVGWQQIGSARETADAVRKAADQHGYSAHFINPTGMMRGKGHSGYHKAMIRRLDDLYARRVDGMIVHQTHQIDPQIVKYLLDGDVPVVFVDWAPAGCRNSVSVNRRATMRRVAEHLYDLGHRRVLQVRSPTDAHSPFFRVDPYRKAGQVCGLVVEVSDDWILSSQAKSLGDLADHAYRLVYDAAREDRLPTAMLTHSDACAIAAVAAVQDAGLRVPEDVSIVGFDDEMEGRFCRPALTTMRLPDHEIGQAAFEMLCQLMREPRAVIEPRSFDCELVLRKSTGPAPDRN